MGERRSAKNRGINQHVKTLVLSLNSTEREALHIARWVGVGKGRSVVKRLKAIGTIHETFNPVHPKEMDGKDRLRKNVANRKRLHAMLQLSGYDMLGWHNEHRYEDVIKELEREAGR